MTRWLRNKTMAVKVLDDKDLNGSTVIDPNADPFEGVAVAAAYAEVAKDLITHAALTIGGVFAAYKIIERICR